MVHPDFVTLKRQQSAFPVIMVMINEKYIFRSHAGYKKLESPQLYRRIQLLLRSKHLKIELMQ